MKILKKILIFILSLFIYISIILINLNLTIKPLIEKQLASSMMTDVLASETSKILDDTTKIESSDSLKEDLMKNKKLAEKTQEYTDYIFDYIAENTDKELNVKEYIKEIIKDTKDTLNEKYSLDITDDKIDQAIEDLDREININQYYKNQLDKNIETVDSKGEQAIKIYQLITSPNTLIISITVIIIMTLLIILLQRPIYRVLKKLGSIAISAGITTVILTFSLERILKVALINYSVKQKININNALTTNIITIVIGIILIITYLIVNVIIKNKEKTSI